MNTILHPFSKEKNYASTKTWFELSPIHVCFCVSCKCHQITCHNNQFSHFPSHQTLYSSLFVIYLFPSWFSLCSSFSLLWFCPHCCHYYCNLSTIPISHSPFPFRSPCSSRAEYCTLYYFPSLFEAFLVYFSSQTMIWNCSALLV